VSTSFKVLSEDDVATTSTATATESMKEEKLHEGKDDDSNNLEREVIYLPIEMTVEISSNSLHHQNHPQNDQKHVLEKKHQHQLQEHEGNQKKKFVIFKTTGTIRGERIPIGHSVDTTPQDGHEILRGEYESLQSPLNQSASRMLQFEFESITVDLNCELLLSQMIEEASNVVSLTVELTNFAWTNNTKKQQEIIDSTMSLFQQQERQADVDASISTAANIIADDDSIYIPRATGRRSRANSIDDMLMGPPGSNVHIVRQELSFCGGSLASSSLPLVSEEETDEHQDQEEAPTNKTAVVDVAAAVSSTFTSGTTVPPTTTMTKTATFTNLDVVHRDNTERKRKSRDFVSIDQSFVSELLDEDQQEHDLHNDAAHEDLTHKDDDVDVDAEYYKVAAERACSIVDFVFAGEEITKFMDVIPSSSAKRLRFE